MGRLAAVSAAVLCGVGGGALYLAVLLGSPGALILVYLTQLPLFAAGLWLGVGAAVIAGVTATLMMLAASDVLAAAVFAGLNAVPVALLVRQALLARRAPDETVAWYPPGLLTGWLTAIAFAGIATAVIAFGGPSGLHAALRQVIDQALSRLGSPGSADEAELADALALVVPGIIAASWMVMAIINGSLAQGILGRFKLNWRPSPDLAALDLPVWIPIALAAAAALTLLGEDGRFFGVNAIVTLSVPFCLAGLGVVHALTRRFSNPRFALVVFYVLAGLFGWPLLVAAALGLVEPWLGLRRRLAPR
ncbi:MAG TPA: DUF2232 domain-containing protein [Stellaceae bacterium]|jgi:hypothetical protein|nr:DUF2232 domain-containing protein [Stellaceae bacterium]